MNQEEKEIMEYFEHNFSLFKSKKIMLYGIGDKTKLILDEFLEYNFIGLLDGAVTGGYFNNKRVYPIEFVSSRNVDIIIISSKKENVEIIYKRIYRFCRTNGILLYDVYGRDLFEYFGFENDKKYYELNKEALIDLINRHEVITFDIFDTLVMRKTLYPSDMFEIMKHRIRKLGVNISNFQEVRMRADVEIAHTSPNIYEIYDNMQKMLGLSDNQKNMLINTELEIEKNILIRRDVMIEMMEYAIKKGKKVCLVSDMYLPSNVLDSILDALSISGYNEIFVSCDYRRPKTGGLFRYVKEKYPAASYLHIGDNEESDGNAAVNEGMKYFLIKNARDMLCASTYAELIHCTDNVNERSLLGLAIAKLFNDPFILYKTEGKPMISEVHKFGYFFAGPLITTFIMWFLKKVKLYNIDKILFSARDGFIIQQLYDIALEKLKLTDMPEGIYFHTSRMLCAKAALDSEEDIKWMMGPSFRSTPENMILDRFELDKNDIKSYAENRYETIIDYVMEHKEKILVKSEKTKKLYMEYMESMGLRKGEKYALFDFVSCGTCQYFLDKITPYDIMGIYFGKYDSGEEKKNRLNIDAMFKNSFLVCKESNFIKYYLFFETIMTSYDTSVSSISDSGKLKYNVETRTEEELNYVREMHKTILEFFNDYIDFLMIDDIDIGIKVVDKIIGCIDPSYTNNKCDILNKIYLVDDFGNGKINLSGIM